MVLCSLVPTLLQSGTARADEEGSLADTASALPGLVRVALPERPPSVGAVAVTAGYGYTESVLGDRDAHHRTTGTIAGSVRVIDVLAIGARLDGRYDRHTGDNGVDDGWVGDPRLFARARTRLGAIDAGAQVGLWLPGRNAPSLVAAATSLDLLLLGAWRAPSAPVTLAANIGFRLDNSADSAQAPDRLSDADRLALGVSDSNAVLIGLGGAWRASRSVEVVAETSWDVLVGSRSPGALRSPLRAAVGTRLRLSEPFALLVDLEATLGRRPTVEAGAPLSPIEPRLSAVVGLSFRAPAPRRATPRILIVREPGPPRAVPDGPAPPEPTGTVQGRVTGPDGSALPGARVRITSGRRTVEVTTGPDGRFASSEVVAGAAVARFSASGHRDAERSVGVEPAATTVVDVALELALPRGALRGVVSALRGEPIAGATVTVEPLGTEVDTDAEGGFVVDVPPGHYTVVVRAAGHGEQRRAIQVEENGVTVLNVDLRPGR